MDEKRGFEAIIEDLRAQLAAEQAKATWSIPKPSCFMQSSPFYGIGVPTWDESTGTLPIKPPLGRPYYITYKGKEYVKVDRAPKEGDVINVTSMSNGLGETSYGNELAQVLRVYSGGDMDLDNDVFGANSFLVTSYTKYNDKYDAVYEPVND